MPRTYFQEFTKDNGTPVNVMYQFRAGSETSYSPRYGADGGDACEVIIISSWPNTPEYNAAYEKRAQRREHLDPLRYSDEDRDIDAELNADIERDEERAQLTDAEAERMEIWLIEHHVDEPDDDDIAF